MSVAAVCLFELIVASSWRRSQLELTKPVYPYIHQGARHAHRRVVRATCNLRREWVWVPLQRALGTRAGDGSQALAPPTCGSVEGPPCGSDWRYSCVRTVACARCAPAHTRPAGFSSTRINN